MSFVVGIVIGALAMWLREWVTAKPSSPLLRLPAADLRAALSRAEAASHEAHARWIDHRFADRHGSANSARDTYHRMLDEVVMLRDALRIVEAREAPPRQGAYR